MSSRFMVGWAVGARQGAPCRLRIETLDQPAAGGEPESAGRPVARAVARGFRRDLLAAGVGHGHYGFTARLTEPLAPGEHRFALFDEAAGEIVVGNAGESLVVGDAAATPPMRVEDLLEQVDHWVEDDLLAHVALLRLEANLTAMGIARFVDVTFHYVLNRWADPDGARIYDAALRARELTAEAFFATLLRSEERRATHAPLVSPYDPQFPYALD